ncbi:hypothetical protein C5167_033917 [Papaver somniferum]|uniref:Uncharacterized protein n=1 Tax=Papaver somniferum TaxID=3469 RepID=A0A4Y7KFN1_PAPSO|nr:hypothetical protein C5167_033917 [Papaver somniferum]
MSGVKSSSHRLMFGGKYSSHRLMFGGKYSSHNLLDKMYDPGFSRSSLLKFQDQVDGRLKSGVVEDLIKVR